jgi:FAD:protein FMN transferase
MTARLVAPTNTTFAHVEPPQRLDYFLRMKLNSLLGIVAPIVLTAGPFPGPLRQTSHTQAFTFHRDGVLGTSVDLTFVTGSAGDAERAEQVALGEIERLRRILSSWDNSSEVSRLFERGALRSPSPELLTVLREYTAWNDRSGHAYSARIGALTQLWREAATRGVLPDSATLTRTVAEIEAPAWQIDSASGAIIALTPQRIDLSSLGKGFVIDRVMAALRDSMPTLRGALVNIGGDIHAWGMAPAGAAWRVAVANPRDHADNATPLTRLAIRDRAVSSSGNYERGFTIGGRHYSHIIDPRTGYPADAVVGTTVIARDNATANALATILSVLGPDAGVRLVRSVPGAEALLVTAGGTIVRTPGFAAYEVRRDAETPRHAAAFTATMAIDVTPNERMRHSPYVAVWITDTTGHQIRTLLFWGEKPKYQRELSRFWDVNHTDTELLDAVTRATRPAGKYSLEWDGLDQKGATVPPGPYVFWLEAAFEDGPHSSKSATVTCGAAHATGTIPRASAFAGAEIACDPVKP